MDDSHTHERRFHGEADRLRSSERVALLEVERVVATSLEGLIVRSMLDVGTGTGVFAEAFAKSVPAVTGIDSNADLIAIARSYVPDARFIKAQAESLPFEDGAFDLVFLGHVLHETDNAVRALEETRRVTVRRSVVLEWPYQQEEQGPPLEHRLKPEAIEDFADKAGYRHVERVRLEHMVLYRLTP